jgi:hypothetical protein
MAKITRWIYLTPGEVHVRALLSRRSEEWRLRRTEVGQERHT